MPSHYTHGPDYLDKDKKKKKKYDPNKSTMAEKKEYVIKRRKERAEALRKAMGK